MRARKNRTRNVAFVCAVVAVAGASALGSHKEYQQSYKRKQAASAGDPVNLLNGGCWLRETDLSVKARNMDIDFVRSYASYYEPSTALGERWTMNWFKKVVIDYEPDSGASVMGTPPPVCFGVRAKVEQILYYDGELGIHELPLPVPDPFTNKVEHGNSVSALEGGTFGLMKSIDDEIIYAGFYPDRYVLRTADGMIYTFADAYSETYIRPKIYTGPGDTVPAPDLIKPTGLGGGARGNEGGGTLPLGGATAGGGGGGGTSSVDDGNGFIIGTPPTYCRTTFRLTSVEDRHGNVLAIETEPHGPTKIIDMHGREITFNYTGTQLTGITDFDQRTVRYGHHGTALVSVTSPAVTGTSTLNDFPLGATTSYEYGSKLNITAIYRPQDLIENPQTPAPYLRNIWDGVEERIVQQHVGGTNASDVPAGGTYRFIYDHTPRIHGWFTEVTRTLTINRNGDAALTIFDSDGNDVLHYQFTGRLDPAHPDLDTLNVDDLVTVDVSSQLAAMNPALNYLNVTAPYTPPMRSAGTGPAASTAVDPPCHITRKVVNKDGLIVETEGPGGHFEYVYDEDSNDRFQQGNQLKSIQHPDDGSAPIVTLWAYEPFFQQVRAVVDPRGNDAAFIPPNDTVPDVSNNSLQRYMQRYTFDYQEGSITAGAMDDLAAEWGIDTTQASMYTALPGLVGVLPAISDAGSGHGLGDLNGDALINQVNGNMILDEAPAANVLDLPTVADAQPGFVSQPGIHTFQYNDYSQLFAVVDPEGYTRQFLYYQQQDPVGVSQPASLDGGGFLAQERSDEGVTLSYRYNDRGLAVEHRNGRGFATLFEFNAWDDVVALWDEVNQHRIEKVYDANRYVVEVRRDNRTPAIDPATGRPIGGYLVRPDAVDTMTYDILGNLVQTETRASTYADVNATTPATTDTIVRRFRYDAECNHVLTLLPNWEPDTQTGDPSNVTSTVYDERGLVRCETEGGVTSEFRALPAHAHIAEVAWIPPAPPAPAMLTSVFSAYDDRGKLLEEIDGAGHRTAFAYDGFGRLRSETDPLGNVVEFSYDVASNVVQIDQRDAAGQLLASERSRHDEQSRVYQTDKAIDTVGLALPVAITDGPLTPGDGWVTHRTVFDGRGQGILTIDDNRACVGHSFDGDRQEVAQWDTSGDALPTWTDAVSYRRESIFDGAGNAIQVKSIEHLPDGTYEVFNAWYSYDSLDRLTAAIDNAGNTRRFAYSSLSKIVFESDAESSDLAFAYLFALDGASELAALADPPPTMKINNHGNTTLYEFDDAGRQLAMHRHLRVGGTGDGVIDPTQAGDGMITNSVVMDRNSQVIQRIDDNGNAFTYRYDSLGRLAAQIAADGATKTALEYDGNHRLIRRRDANANEVSLLYDPAGRLTLRTIQRGAGVKGPAREEFAYDGLGRLVTAVTGPTTLSYEYDSLSRPVRETQDGVHTHTVYDGVGFLTRILYPGGREIVRTFDEVNRLEQVRDTSRPEALAMYRWAGQRRPVQLDLIAPAAGLPVVRRTFDYDTRRALTSIHTIRMLNPGPDPDVDHRTYQWDREGNRTLRRDELNGVAHAYTYDSGQRLIRSSRTGSSMDRTVEYTLDGVGNRETVAGGRHAGGYEMGPLDAKANRYSRTPVDTRVYDANGNLATVGAGGGQLVAAGPVQGIAPTAINRQLKFDWANRLKVVRDLQTETTTRYRYDALGRRVAKVVDGVETVFVYQGFNVIEEQDGNGATLRTFVYGPGEDNVVSMTSGATTYLYVNDDLGNVFKVIDDQGADRESYQYEDYGEPLNGQTLAPLRRASAVGNPYLFAGRRYDFETGWYYFRHRYMDPIAGRFLTPDPIGTWGDAENLGNAYAYVSNNPWTRVDPTGLKPRPPKDLTKRDIEKKKRRVQKRARDAAAAGEISQSERARFNEQADQIAASASQVPSQGSGAAGQDALNAAGRLLDAVGQMVELTVFYNAAVTAHGQISTQNQLAATGQTGIEPQELPDIDGLKSLIDDANNAIDRAIDRLEDVTAELRDQQSHDYSNGPIVTSNGWDGRISSTSAQARLGSVAWTSGPAAVWEAAQELDKMPLTGEARKVVDGYLMSSGLTLIFQSLQTALGAASKATNTARFGVAPQIKDALGPAPKNGTPGTNFKGWPGFNPNIPATPHSELRPSTGPPQPLPAPPSPASGVTEDWKIP